MKLLGTIYVLVVLTILVVGGGLTFAFYLDRFLHIY